MLAVVVVATRAAVVRADVESGPAVGEKIPALKVEAVTGPQEGKSLDYAADRAEKPTVYAFVQAERWSRPMARFLKKIDGELQGIDDAACVAVWLAEKPDASKEYLPKAQMSLKFERTSLTSFAGEIAGPNGWGVNGDAHVTVVVARGGKTVARFGFVSVNETSVPQVIETLKK